MCGCGVPQQGVFYEMVTVKEPKSQQKPEDNTTVQYDTVTKFAGGQVSCSPDDIMMM